MEIDWTEAIKLYKEGFGTSYIGEKFGTASNTIRRGLIKRSVPMRSKAEAQRLALESGRVKHPTEGTTRNPETKRKIGEASHLYFESLSDEEKKKIAERSRKNWKSRSPEDIEDMQQKASVGLRDASKNGSKLEKFLLSKIRELGLDVEWHLKQTLENSELEIDLCLSGLRVAIEVDGIFHYEQVFSNKDFGKTVRADNEKNGLLLKNGFCVVRIRNTKKNVSQYMFEKCWDNLKAILEEIQRKFPKLEDRLIEFEVV